MLAKHFGPISRTYYIKCKLQVFHNPLERPAKGSETNITPIKLRPVVQAELPVYNAARGSLEIEAWLRALIFLMPLSAYGEAAPSLTSWEAV